MKRAFIVAVIAVAAVAAPARADEPKRAIVVPTQLGGFIPNRHEVQLAIDVLVANRLRRARVNVVSPSSLSAEEAQCQEDVCLAEIAARRHVDVVVASRLINDEQRNLNAYHIAVRMFVRDELPAIRVRDKTCTYCSEDKATDMLAVTVAEAYANEPTEAAPAPAAVAAPAPTANSALTPTSRPWLTTPLVRYGSLALGAGGVVALALGGWKASQDGSVTCDPDCQRRDTSAGQAAAFTVGSVAIAAAVPLALFAWRGWRAERLSR
jgi:hypothetical protein